MKPGIFKFGQTTFVSEEDYEKLVDVNWPTSGDIVFAREGSFGVACLVLDKRKYAIGQRTMMLRADPKLIDPIFLTWFINSPTCQKQLLNISMGTTVRRVNVADVKELPIPLPPIEKQREFAAIVRRFERLRAGQIEAERQANHLFQTLLHQAFSH